MYIRENFFAASSGESDTRFLTSSLFHESVSPSPLSTPWGPFWIFMDIRWHIRSFVFIAGVFIMGDKLFTCMRALMIIY
jgi:hypothetical protein